MHRFLYIGNCEFGKATQQMATAAILVRNRANQVGLVSSFLSTIRSGLRGLWRDNAREKSLELDKARTRISVKVQGGEIGEGSQSAHITYVVVGQVQGDEIGEGSQSADVTYCVAGQVQGDEIGEGSQSADVTYCVAGQVQGSEIGEGSQAPTSRMLLRDKSNSVRLVRQLSFSMPAKFVMSSAPQRRAVRSSTYTAPESARHVARFGSVNLRSDTRMPT